MKKTNIALFALLILSTCNAFCAFSSKNSPSGIIKPQKKDSTTLRQIAVGIVKASEDGGTTVEDALKSYITHYVIVDGGQIEHFRARITREIAKLLTAQRLKEKVNHRRLKSRRLQAVLR